MTNLPPIYVEFKGNASDLLAAVKQSQRSLRGLDDEVKKTSKSFSGFKSVLTGLSVAAAVAGMQKMVTGASGLQESISKVNVVFGANADEVQAWSKTTATSLGISRQAALEAAGTYGNLMKAFGLTDAQAQVMSTSLVTLAADMASFNNTPVDEALQALRSGLSGETEPLKRFGVAINENRLKLEAMNLNLYNGTGVMSQAAKTQAAYALIMKDTALSQGDVARTAEGYANQIKFLQAGIKDASDSIGAAFLPSLTNMVNYINTYIMPSIQAFINGLTGDTSVISSLDKSGQQAYAWGRVVVAVFNTVVGFKDEIIKVGAAIVAMWAISKAVSAAGAIVKIIEGVTKAYTVLTAVAAGATVAQAAATGGISLTAAAVGTTAALAAVAGMYVAVGAATKKYKAELVSMPDVGKMHPSQENVGLSSGQDVTLPAVDSTGPVSTKGMTKKQKAAEAAKQAAAEAKKAADEYASRTKQIAKDTANAILANTRSHWQTVVSAAEAARSLAQEEYQKTLGLLREATSGLGGGLNISEMGGSSSRILAMFKRQLEKIKDFVSNVNRLKDMGLHPMIISQLVAAGPMDGSRAAKALVGDPSAISQLNAMQSEFVGVALGASSLYQPNNSLENVALGTATGRGYTTAEAAYQSALTGQSAAMAVAEAAAAQYEQTNNFTINIDAATYEDPAKLAQAIADAVAAGVKTVPAPAAAEPAKAKAKSKAKKKK